MDFNDKVQQAIQNRVLKDISNTRLLEHSGHKKHSIPNTLLESAWLKIDWDDVLISVTDELQKRVANAIIGKMATEINTDVKKIMSLPGLREELRIKVYPVFLKAVKDLKKK